MSCSRGAIASGHVVKCGADHVRGVVWGAGFRVRGQAELGEVCVGAVGFKHSDQQFDDKRIDGQS